MRLEEHPTVISYRNQTTGLPTSPEVLEADCLKQAALDAGADDVGLVELERPELDQMREALVRVFPEVKTLVSIIKRLNPANVRCVHRSVSDREFYNVSHDVERVGQNLAEALSKRGVPALNSPAGFPMDLSRWPGGIWQVQHKTVAEAAGTGKMGLSRILLHPVFGSFVFLGTVLVSRRSDAYDQPIDYNPCLGCKLCTSVCPVGAIAADGHFNFANCMTHNYRDRLGGFSDWVENIVKAKDVKDYRARVSDPETVSMWQSLSYGICNKSSYCMAACPAGEEVIGPFLDHRKNFMTQVVKPLQDNDEQIFVAPGSDAEAHVQKKFPHKRIKRVGNGLRPDSAQGFINTLSLVFQRGRARGLSAVYNFTFTGAEPVKANVTIKDQTLDVQPGLAEKADLSVIADGHAWVKFLAKEKSLLPAILGGKIKLKGSPLLLKRFAQCFLG